MHLKFRKRSSVGKIPNLFTSAVEDEYTFYNSAVHTKNHSSSDYQRKEVRFHDSYAEENEEEKNETITESMTQTPAPLSIHFEEDNEVPPPIHRKHSTFADLVKSHELDEVLQEFG